MVKSEGKWEIKDDDQASGLDHCKGNGATIYQDREEEKKFKEQRKSVWGILNLRGLQEMRFR